MIIPPSIFQPMRHRAPPPSYRSPAAVRPSHHAEFWPTGWLVWASIGLAVFDAAMLANLVRLVVMR